MRNFRMLQVAQCALSLPGLPAPGLRAPWPVWKDSTTAQVKWQPIPKRIATRRWHMAREFDRQIRQKGKHGGVGHTAMLVYHSLIFDFLNYGSGRLDPSYDTIARKANLCRATVWRALKRLLSLGMLNWIRRCTGRMDENTFSLEQETNAYAILPCSQWLGYRPPAEAPPPAPGTWGDHPCGARDAFMEMDTAKKTGGGADALLRALESDSSNELAAALARLGRANGIE